MTTVCLAMIVKDEEDVIGRCIESVRDLIDTWVICDTGSTDATRERAMEALEGLPGSWHDRPWVDFGHNRSELMALARGHADYLLLLDADETVAWRRGLKEKLHGDSYRILHVGTTEHWTNKKLVRGDIAWRYIGAAHEYIEADVADDEELLEDLVIEAHIDKPRPPKLHRNLQLLLAQLERTPDHSRFVFYLAETYRDLFELEEPKNPDYARRAIEQYERRVELDGFADELFVSRFHIAALTADALEDWPAALNAFVELWESAPWRLEPLYGVVSRLRLRGQVHTAYALLPQALELELPPEGIFVKSWMYEWGIQAELALLSYMVGEFEESLAAAEALLENPKLPAEHRPGFEEVRQLAREAVAQTSPSGTGARR